MNNQTNTSSELHVIFGTGPLGTSVMRELVARGKRVRMVNRSGKAAEIPAGVEVVSGDAYDSNSTRALTKGATVVYQCAQPAYHEWKEKFPAFQQGILDGVAANGAKFIVGENLYMYGEVKGLIREDLPYAAKTKKGKVRGEMSQALLAAHKSGKVRVAMARASDFYGPGVLESLIGDRVVYPAMAGKAMSFAGDLDAPHTITYINDFGKAMVILGERDEALGQAWHVPNDTTLTQRQIGELIFQELGMPPKMSAMGRLMMQIGGIFIVGARETVEMLYEFEKPFVVDSSKFEKAFGMKATPIREGIKAMVAWYRAHPQVKH